MFLALAEIYEMNAFTKLIYLLRSQPFVSSMVRSLKVLQMRILLAKQTVEGSFVFVTGADSSHYKTAQQFLRSYFRFESESKIVFYDLGLTDLEKKEFKKEFPEVVFKTFDYSRYPDYFDIKKDAGCYAWKPVIFWETLNENKCKVMWMDAGTLITAPLDNLKKYICMQGYFWNYSPDTIERWTHPKTLSYLDVPKESYNHTNLAAGAVAVDYNCKEAVSVAREWKECAMDKDCISPDGADRSNHRQDQAVLTILAYKHGLARGKKLRRKGFLVQQDID